jgi:Oxidoreductase FAD-binding domain
MRSSSRILLCEACSQRGLLATSKRSFASRSKLASQSLGQIRRSSSARGPRFDTRGAHLLLPVGVAGLAGGVFLFGYWYTQEREKSSYGKAQGNLHPENYRPLKVIRSDLSTSLMMPDQRGDGLHRHVKLALNGVGDTNDHFDPKYEDGSMRIDSIYIKQPDIQIERAYTPLLSKAQSEHSGCIDLLVKRYEDGEMGRYIQSIPVGGKLECRGWDTTWDSKWHPNKDVKHVYMVSLLASVVLNSCSSNVPWRCSSSPALGSRLHFN